MSRMISAPLFASSRASTAPVSVITRRLFASTEAKDTGTQNSRPGWEGRHGDDHAVKRDGNDVQSHASQEAMKQHNEGKGESSSGQAISRKDETNANKRAKEEHPEAPGPVIGMNDERGGKGN